MAIKVANYISNLGKSVAYAAVDKFGKMSPTSSDLVQTNSELFKEVTTNIINYKTTYKRSLNYIKTSKIYEAADTGITSIFEDLQSGKLWNKQRIDKITEKNLGFGEDSFKDFDFGSDNNNEDFGSFDPSSDISKGDEVISNMIATSAEQSAQMISSTIARSSKYIADTQKTATHMLYTQNMQAYNLFNSNLASINSNISKVLSFQTTTIQTHAENSKKYFEQTTILMQQQTALLQQIAQAVAPKKEEAKQSSSRITYNDIMGTGVPDLKAYIKNVKKNLANSLGSITSLNSMMGEDSNMLEMFVASPLQFIPSYIINKMIPKSLDKAVRNFDNSLKGFFGSIIAKINSMKSNDNIILSKIGEIFGINNAAKSSLDTKGYQKGKVDWDGKSRKALIEVIPAQLSKIISLLSGKAERLFDYDEGKFVDASTVEKNFKNEKKRYVQDASSDVLSKIDEYMKVLTFNTVDEQKKLRQDIDKILAAVYERGGFFDLNSKNNLDYIDYGVDSKSLTIFKTLFRNMDRSTQLQLGSKMIEQRDKQTRDMKDKEAQADSILQSLFNGFNAGEFIDKKGNSIGGIGGGLLKTLDNKGHNLFYYLQNIWKELALMRRNSGSGSNDYGEILYGNTSYDISKARSTFNIPDDRKNKPETEARRKAEREEAIFSSDKQRALSKDKNIINVSDITDERDLSNKITGRLELDSIKKGFIEKREEKKSLIDKLLEAQNLTDKSKTIIEKLNEITRKPMTFIVDTINKVDKRMYEMVFGSTKYKGQDVNGIFGIIKLELTSKFAQFNNFIDEKILNPMKQKLGVENMKDIGKKIFGMFGIDIESVKKDMHDYLFNKDTGLFSAIKDGISSVFKNAFEVSKNSIKSVYGPLYNKIRSKKSKKDSAMIDALDQLDINQASNNNVVQPNSVAETISKLIDTQKTKNEGIFEYNKYEYTKGLKKLANLDDSEQGILESIFDTFANNPMELDSLKFSALLDLTKELTAKDRNYAPVYKKLLKYSHIFGNPAQLSIDYILKNNGMKENSVTKTAADFAESAFANTGSGFDQGSILKDVMSDIKDKVSGIFDLLKNTFGNKPSLIHKPSPLEMAMVTNPEGKATFNFAQDLTNVIANWMYKSMPHYDQGGIVDAPQVSTVGKGEVILTPENVKSLINILNDIEAGSASGMSAKKIGTGTNKRVQQFLNSSNISSKDDFSKFMSYSVEDSTMFGKLQELQTNKLYNKVFSIFNINLERALEEYTMKATQLDKDGIPTDPVQRAMYNESEPFAKKVVDELYNGTVKVKDALFGKDEKKDKKKFGEAVSDVTKNITKYAPEAIGAGLLGGGVSLITGAIGGPLLGAAVGAGISLTKNSEKVQNWLFGDFDQDTHERKGGVIPKKYIDKISKLAPDLMNFGIAGGLTGLLPMVPFGPVGGLLIGSSVAFAKNNEKMRSFLFGEDGLIKPKTQEKIKKFLPRMAAGAGIGILTGPFGLLGNAAVGAAGGMLTSTETFNKFFFGVKDPKTGEYENGLLPSVRHVIIDPLKSFMTVTNTKIQDFIDEKILSPLKEAFDPIKKDIHLLFKGMFDKVGDFLNNMFEKSFGIPLNKFVEDKLLKPIKGIAGGIFKALTFLPKKIISAPFSLIGGYGKSRRRSHIRNGNADYMTAEERVNYRKTNNVNGLFSKDKFADFDEMLVNMSDDDKQELFNTLDLLDTDNLQGKKSELTKSMGSEISKYLSYGDSKAAMKLINAGDTNLAKKLIDKQNTRNLKLSSSREDLLKQLNGSWNDKTLSPSERAKFLRTKQKDIYKLFDNATAKKIEGFIKNGEFDKAGKIINGLRDKDNTKAFDLVNFIDENSNKLSMTNKMINNSQGTILELQKKLGGIPGFENLDLTNKRDIQKYMNLIKKEIGVKTEQDPNVTTEQVIGLEIEQKNHKEIIDIFKHAVDLLEEIASKTNIDELNTDESKKRSAKDAYTSSFGKSIQHNNKQDRTDKLRTDLINKRFEEINNSNLPKEVKQMALKDLMKFKSGKANIGTLHNIKTLPSLDDYLNKFKSDTRYKYHITEEDVRSRERNEKNAIEDAGLDSKDIANYAGGGVVNKTGIAALSKGEYINTPNTVRDIMQSVPMLLKNLTKRDSTNTNIFQRMLDKLTSLVQINKDNKNMVEKIDDQGNVMKFFRNSRNDLVADKGDNGTRKAIEEAREKESGSKGLFGKLGDMFKGFMDKVNPFSKKEGKKSSFFDGLLDKAKNVAGIAAGVMFLPQIIKFVAPLAKELWDNSISPFLKNTVGPWLRDTVIPFLGKTLGDSISYTITKLLPALAKGVGNILGLSGEHGDQSLGGHTAEVLARNAAQGSRGTRFITSTAEKIGSKSIKGYVGKNVVRGGSSLITKTGNLLTKPFKAIDNIKGFATIRNAASNKVGDAILNKGIKASEAVTNAVTNEKGLIGKLTKKIATFMEKLTTNKTFIKLAGNKKIAGASLAKPLIKFIEDHAISLAGKISGKVAAALSTGGLLNIAIAVGDFVSGFNGAESMMGITQNASLGMKLTAGLIKALNGFLLFGIIPENILVDIFLPIFDKNGDIKAMRQSASDEVAKYNEEHGTNYSVSQYNYEVLGRRGFFGNIKKGITSAASGIKNGAMYVGGKIKDGASAVGNWAGNTLESLQTKSKQLLSDATSKATKAFNDIRGGISGAADNMNKKLGAVFGMIDDKGQPMKLTDGVSKGWAKFTDDVKDKISGMKNTALDTFSNFYSSMKDKFGKLKEAFGKGLKNLDTKIGSMLGLEDEEGNPISLTEGISKGVNKIKSNVTTGWNNFKSGVSNVASAGWNKLRGLFGGNGPDSRVANTNKMRDGGFGAGTANGMVYYSQGDADWKNNEYGSGTIESSGCGPTSAAMVISSLTKQNVTPVDTAAYSVANGYRVPGVGTSWGFFKSIGNKYGIDFAQTTDKTAIMDALKNNQPVIFSGKGEAPFTKGGHFIVGAGSDGGNIKVNDPVSLARSKAYPSSQIFSDMATAFIANKKLDGSIPSDASSDGSDGTNGSPSVFNMLTDLQSAMSNDFNKIFGFSSANQSSNYVGGPENGLASSKLVNYIKLKEGFRSSVYKDSAGVPTIGYGTTASAFVDKGTISEPEAAAELARDINSRAVQIKKQLDKNGVKLNQNEFDALVSLAYNVGTPTVLNSTLFKRLVAGERGQNLVEEFNKYVKSKGQVVPGLVKRRQEEGNIFVSASAPGYSEGGYGNSNSEMLKYRNTKAGGFGLAPRKIEYERAGGFGPKLSYNAEETRISRTQSNDSTTMTLIKSIVTVLVRIAANTDKLQNIVELLAKVLDVNIPKQKIEEAKSAAGANQLANMLSDAVTNNDMDNSQILNILNKLATE